MPLSAETHPQLTIYDIPPPDEQPGWRERVALYGEGVIEVTQFISELSEGVTQRQKDRLIYQDEKSTKAAYATGKLAHYKAGAFILDGEINDAGIADSSCLWTDPEAAAATVHDPDHIEGTEFIIDENIYKRFIIKKYTARQDADIGLRLTLVRTMTKEQIEKHINTRRQYATLSNR